MNTEDKLLLIADYMAMQKTHEVTYDFKPDGIFVFGREEDHMAQAASSLYRRNGPCWVLLSGGIGKGSGPRSRAMGSEAMHLCEALIEYGVDGSHVFLETLAKNGVENTRFGIDVIREARLPHKKIALVMHARAARRLYATHTFVARIEKDFHAEYRVQVPHDPFDPKNPEHAREVLSEFIKVAEWPGKNWGDPQEDYPHDLLPWARGKLRHYE